MSTEPTPQQVLDLSLPDNDSGAHTIRGYLIALLRALWRDAEGFSSKRPFGNSDWPYEVYGPLVRAGLVSGRFDEDGYLEHVDIEAADELMDRAIRALDGIA